MSLQYSDFGPEVSRQYTASRVFLGCRLHLSHNVDARSRFSLFESKKSISPGVAPMPTARIVTTSPDSVAVEPFAIRPGLTTRLVFKPELVNNQVDHLKPVRGQFVWQRRSPSKASEAWEDESHYKLSQMKAGCGMKLELSTDEIYLLTQIVRGLYGVFWKNENRLPQHGEEFDLADYAKAARSLDTAGDAAEIIEALGVNGFAQFLHRIAQHDNVNEAVAAISKLDTLDLQAIHGLAGISMLRQALAFWEANQGNPKEEFWQNSLSEHSFVLSQVFSYPVVVICEKAHVGGKNVANTGGKQSDFLLKSALTNHLLLVEIKSPTAALLDSTPYRQRVFAPSKELSGSVSQISSYKLKLSKEFDTLRTETEDTLGESIRFAEPRCLVIIGSLNELDDAAKRDSFELYRRGQRHTEVITFDELFGKVAVLLGLLEGKEQLVDSVCQTKSS